MSPLQESGWTRSIFFPGVDDAYRPKYTEPELGATEDKHRHEAFLHAQLQQVYEG